MDSKKLVPLHTTSDLAQCTGVQFGVRHELTVTLACTTDKAEKFFKALKEFSLNYVQHNAGIAVKFHDDLSSEFMGVLLSPPNAPSGDKG